MIKNVLHGIFFLANAPIFAQKIIASMFYNVLILIAAALERRTLALKNSVDGYNPDLFTICGLRLAANRGYHLRANLPNNQPLKFIQAF